jgi:hypothetical protein
MRAFLQRVWARISPYSADSTPLIAHTHNHSHDLEAYGHPDSGTIDLVCEQDGVGVPGPPELGCEHPQHAYPQYTHPQFTHTHPPPRISPFSEDHSPFSPRPPSPA